MIPVFRLFQTDALGPGIVNGYPLIFSVVLNNAIPRDQECFACFSRALPEFNGKVPYPAGFYKKVRDGIYLMNVIFVRMEVLGEVEFLVNDGLAFNGKVIGRVQRVNEHVHVLAGELVLLEPVRKALKVVRFEKTVQAMDDLPLKITHRSMV
jgi:hypothetical protein